jgi:hypothetical protein
MFRGYRLLVGVALLSGTLSVGGYVLWSARSGGSPSTPVKQVASDQVDAIAPQPGAGGCGDWKTMLTPTTPLQHTAGLVRACIAQDAAGGLTSNAYATNPNDFYYAVTQCWYDIRIKDDTTGTFVAQTTWNNCFWRQKDVTARAVAGHRYRTEVFVRYQFGNDTEIGWTTDAVAAFSLELTAR